MRKNSKYLFFILFFSSTAVKPDIVIGKLKIEYDKAMSEKRCGLGSITGKTAKKVVGLLAISKMPYKNYKKRLTK